MKIRLLIVALLLLTPFLVLAQPSFSQAAEETETNEEEQPEVKPPRAKAGDDIEQLVERKVAFSGQQIEKQAGETITYNWDFGDGQFSEGQKVEHQYQSPGDYKVALTVSNEVGKDVDDLTVKIFDDVIIFLTDDTPPADELESLRRYASRQQVLLFDIKAPETNADYITEGLLADSLLENSEIVKKSSAVVVWTSGSLGLSVLSKFAQKAEDLEGLNMSGKAIINIAEGGFTPVARYAQSTFDVLKPQYILLTKDTSLYNVIDNRNADAILQSIRDSGVDHNLISFYSERAIDKLGPTNFMSYTINFLINRGVSTDNIYLMLILPIIATVVAFARQFLGIKTFGIYTPTIITLSFLATGLKYGLAIFLVILIVATVVRLILKKFRLLYLPRMAMVLTIVALAILAMFVIGALTSRTGIIGLSILPILVLIILVEKFIAIQMEKGPRTAILLSLETILVSVACYFLASWSAFNTFVLAYPEVILLTFVVNILLGRWVGLRISEYIRFRAIRKTSPQSK
ncbi:MAG: PKD domain-containing protein [Parcubacteria group bacterium]|nr:PKD domain-containing protein [Parcubacteria group bacterium]